MSALATQALVIVRLVLSPHQCTCALRVNTELARSCTCPVLQQCAIHSRSTLLALTPENAVRLTRTVAGFAKRIATVQLTRCRVEHYRRATLRQRLGRDPVAMDTYLRIAVTDNGNVANATEMYVHFKFPGRLVDSANGGLLTADLFARDLRVANIWFNSDHPAFCPFSTLNLAILGLDAQQAWANDVLVDTAMVNVYTSSLYSLENMLETE